MRHFKRIVVGFSLLVGANILFVNAGLLSPSEMNGRGLKEDTPQELAHLHKRKIVKVRPNQRAIERFERERKEKGRAPDRLPIPVSSESETEILDGATISGSSVSGSTTTSTELLGAIPTSVDNSKLAAFPPIGNQSSQSSCVAWAVTYYLTSHEVCLTKGCDNKSTSSTRFSPSWTYNMINSGVDQGSYFSDAFTMMSSHGAPSILEVPYSASDFKSWSTNPDHWKNAIKYRTTVMTSMPMDTNASMATAKQYLANGHVIVIGTYINSWVYKQVMANPNGTPSPYAGQSIVVTQNGTLGGHGMTVVGYDDTVWTDINANGVAEAAEIGAFKIANSWGTGWGNAGFVWAAYDSFRSVSEVPGFSTAGRILLTRSGAGFVSTYQPYQPNLLAAVTVSHAARNQMSLQFGASSTSKTSPERSFSPFALVNKGGAFSFGGDAIEDEATFYFDISSINNTASTVANQLFYLTVYDSASGSPLTVKSFSIVDPVIGNTLVSAPGVPIFPDATSKRLIAGNYTVDSTAPSAPSALTATLSSKSSKKGKRTITTTTVALKWTGSADNVGVVSYNVYRNGTRLSSTSSLSYNDTSTSSGVSYTYKITAVDAAGNESAASNLAYISR